MIIGWIIMACLLLASLYYVVSHLTQRKNQHQFMAQFVRLRSAEIEQELESGRIDNDEAQQLKEDLLAEAQTEQQLQLKSLQESIGSARNIILVALGIVVLGSMTVYYQMGYTREILFTDKLANQTATNDDISAFLQYRSQRYGRAEDWYFEAKDYMARGEYVAAVAAYKQSLDSLDDESEERVDIQVEYAQAIFYANNNQVSPRMTQVVDDVLRVRPDQPVALGLKGVSLFDQGDYKGALIAWQNAVIHGKNPQERAALMAGIRKAREVGNISEEDVPALISHRIRLQIDVVSGSLDPHSVYLVYARGSSPMPVAIQRVTSQQLSGVIELTNLDNLMPGASLAQFDQVDVVVKQSPANASDLTQGKIIGQISGVPTQDEQIFQVPVSM
ncbi:c-type cytochrome biogenesis protein CcmI [Maribrevibacterium harenarium]|uniref:C-type cytochrome biogenesis protein CcmI n=1 Tax=Maribrevibacterium harenarium TaxID=2589817 RepID=A0A501X2M0_9GAMM|nr:c-type cytochrome biogenesis protein CcmI [Maribrevibacterium harenarium]TPE54735.1 c-type cytochrome biogenesis protein CcmI [Maribrevibacterium harenarium]